MKDLTQRPAETDLMWQLRLSNYVIAQDRLISVLRQENRLLRDRNVNFELSADAEPCALLRPQAG